MSDTTITQDERARLRSAAATAELCCLPSVPRLSPSKIIHILNALEQAEAQLERSVQETRANFSELYRMATEIVPELKKRIAEAEARAEKAEAMVDWLAGQLHGFGPKYGDVICPQEKCHATRDCIDCWAEAARRAVGDADSEVVK